MGTVLQVFLTGVGMFLLILLIAAFFHFLSMACEWLFSDFFRFLHPHRKDGK